MSFVVCGEAHSPTLTRQTATAFFRWRGDRDTVIRSASPEMLAICSSEWNLGTEPWTSGDCRTTAAALVAKATMKSGGPAVDCGCVRLTRRRGCEHANGGAGGHAAWHVRLSAIVAQNSGESFRHRRRACAIERKRNADVRDGVCPDSGAQRATSPPVGIENIQAAQQAAEADEPPICWPGAEAPATACATASRQLQFASAKPLLVAATAAPRRVGN
jgi:hypothetical protein